VDRLNLHDARNLDVTTRRLAAGAGRRGRMAGQGLQVPAGNPILLANPDRPEPAAADVISHGPHVEAELRRDLLDRQEILAHCFVPGVSDRTNIPHNTVYAFD